MENIYKVSRNIMSGNNEEYEVLVALANEYGAIKIEDEVDLDCYDYPIGEYGKWYLEITFDSKVKRDIFVLKSKVLLDKKKEERS